MVKLRHVGGVVGMTHPHRAGGGQVFQTRAIYDANATFAADWPTIQTSTLCNAMIVNATDDAAMNALNATGAKAIAAIGFWNDSTGAFSVPSDSTAAATASAAVAAHPGVINGWYIADEPSMAHAGAPALIKSRSDALRAVLPVETYIAMWDTSIFSNFKNSVTAFALDGYPNIFGGWNMAVITNQATACDNLGIRYYGVVGAFTDDTGNYPPPTAAQIQTMFATWKGTKQVGWFVYSWGATTATSGNRLENQPTWLAVIKAN